MKERKAYMVPELEVYYFAVDDICLSSTAGAGNGDDWETDPGW